MSALDVFLTVSDLEALAAAHERLAPLTDAERTRVVELASGPDGQERANVLMYPDVLPPETRVAALLDGLREGNGSYTALAAAVGAGELDRSDLPHDQRGEVLEALLDLVARDAGVLGVRAAVALHGVLSATDAAEAVPLLVHPAPAVRRHLLAALLNAVGADGLHALLDSPGFVDPDEADAVRRRLEEDGVRLDDDAPAPTPSLPLLPNREEWDG